jgi:hypothetical protein
LAGISEISEIPEYRWPPIFFAYREKKTLVWAHGVEIEIEETKKWICCMYWNEVFKGGGIHRLKLHLAGEKGEVKQCTHVSAEVRHEMQQSVENFNEKKRKADEDTARVRGGDDREETPQQVATANRVTRG